MAQRLAVVFGVAALVAPALASAQTITVIESNDTDNRINIAECSGAVTNQLSFTWTTTTSGPFDLWASDTAGCPIPTANANTNAHTRSLASSVTTTSLSNLLTSQDLLARLSYTCPGTSTPVSLCVFPAGTNTGGTAVSPVATGSIPVDLQAPPAPNLTGVTPGDTALNVTWSLGSGTADGGSGAPDRFRVYCDESANVPDGADVAHRCAEITGQGTTSTRVTGLKNNTQYTVQVTAVTVGGNESPHSSPLTGVPVEIQDFWRLYKANGGQEQGGCAVGAGGLVALLALAPLAWRRRRRRP